MGINQFSRKWCRLTTYGGKIFENICQAVARDVMSNNMGPIEDAGYAIVLTVHDELITETPDTDAYSSDELSRRLGAQPAWALDMPLAAAGFESYAYRKD
jgi:DNA polymerase